jgi:hypothetical protein
MNRVTFTFKTSIIIRLCSEEGEPAAADLLTWGATPKVGSGLAGVALPLHSSVEELAELADDHVTKEGKQRAGA